MEFNWNDGFDVENSIRWTLLIEIKNMGNHCVYFTASCTMCDNNSMFQAIIRCLFSNVSAHQIAFALSNIEYD